jgi:type III pantothenate kinase
MARLVIDIGNTLVKLAVFNNSVLVEAGHYSTVDDSLLQQLFAKHQITQAIFSSVKKESEVWLSHLGQQLNLIRFERSMANSIHNHYLTPHTLGLDRLAAVMGARHLYPQSNNLVIDAGTCITYDGIDAGANYYGGSISPGLNMRYKALQHYTAGLPLVTADAKFDNWYGNDTTTAIKSGVQNGVLYEVEGFIQKYIQQGTHPNIILTGGDSVFLDTVLKNSIFAGYIKTEPHLVLIGLNAAIQEHND